MALRVLLDNDRYSTLPCMTEMVKPVGDMRIRRRADDAFEFQHGYSPAENRTAQTPPSVPLLPPQRCAGSFLLGMPGIGASSVPTVVRVIASTISRVASGSVIHFL